MDVARPALEFVALTKRYGTSEAVSSLSLAVDAGTTFGLVGANGAGKTTLIKCLLDLCDFSEGSIRIFGVPNTRTEARKRLAFLPERFVPPYYLTAGDFLKLMSRMYQREVDTGRCVGMLNALDLDADVLGKPVRTLSKGMNQKLGIAACLLSERDLLVLDEPTSGLDPKSRALFKTAIANAQSNGRTVFLTSHALADIEETCRQVAVMHQGSLRFSGDPAELKRRHDAVSLEQAFLKCIGEN